MTQPAKTSSRSGAQLVAAGILLSRISGLVRERVFAHYFGNSDAGDAFKAALKIPNFLQNLFGEGVLSASLIPVYAGLMGRGREEEARRVARTIGSLLALVVSLLVLAGVILTPVMIDFVAPGFHGEKRELTIRLVQIFFPGTGLLVLSAWCLGILNSHRRFFLSYSAPVLWNLAIIASLLVYGWGGRSSQENLAVMAAWGLVAGSALQFGLQLPGALKLISGFRPELALSLEPVRTVVRNFVPVVVSRGVVQVSAYIDNVIASYLATGAVSALAYAQTIYLLPIGLFGMSISAAELPAMSHAQGAQTSEEEASRVLRERLDRAMRQIAFFIVPSAVAFLAVGDVIISAIFQTGAFSRDNTLYVWGVLAGSTVGLLSATLGRIYSSAYYALKDTRTPLRFSLVRVALTTVLGALFSLYLPPRLGLGPSWATAGLTASAGIAGWAEFLLLRRGMIRKIGRTGIPMALMGKLWVAAIAAAGAAWGVRLVLPHFHPVIVAVFVLGMYGAVYLGCAVALSVPEVQAVTSKLRRLTGRR